MPIATGFPSNSIFEDECHKGRTGTVRSTCSPPPAHDPNGSQTKDCEFISRCDLYRSRRQEMRQWRRFVQW